MDEFVHMIRMEDCLRHLMRRMHSKKGGVLDNIWVVGWLIDLVCCSIKAMSSNINHELNFQEAHKDAYKAYVIRELPAEVVEIMEHPKVKCPS